jgi:primosomal protein N' (replication factor Y)
MSVAVYVDIILPLAIPRPLTYLVPEEMQSQIAIGKRVVVALGKSKLLTGIIYNTHETAAGNFEYKRIESVLDDEPVCNAYQLKLWEWMATYYCCTLGEVMAAALPSALKLSSETIISILPEFDEDAYPWSSKESIIIESLKKSGSMSIRDLSVLLDQRNVQGIINDLVEKGAVTSEEELKEKFKPKKTQFVALSSDYQTDEQLNRVFADFEKRSASKQSDALLAYLRISNWDGQGAPWIPKSKLTKESGITNAVVSSLIEKGIFDIKDIETGRLNKGPLSIENLSPLSESQNQALNEIKEHWKEKDTVLLHGVTSSGKTELYAHLIRETINRGKQVLFLLPEIALTIQLIDRLKKYFGQRVGVYHSGYSNNERTEVWRKVLHHQPGDYDIVLGARSAIFLPFENLGLIIVDEEHEHSFKQVEPSPRYHARDMSVVLARLHKAQVLLGSATPSVETYWNAESGRYGLVTMQARFGGMELPSVELCDVREELRNKTMNGNFSKQLTDNISQIIDAGSQVILFQNRRGYSPLWKCHVCGWVPGCARCDVSLTYHKHLHQLKCHYCGYSENPPQECQLCGSADLRMIGFGTEKVEEDIAELFPDIKIERMDIDTARSRQNYQKIISEFENGETHILVGTRMITKGLDFDNVGLVGVLSADKMMNYPDFRSLETAYQLMSQVAGRAGRKGKRGRVIIQTFNPEHWLLKHVVDHDYEGFYRHELSERKKFGYPPFVRLIKIVLKHKDDAIVAEAATQLSLGLNAMEGIYVLGPEVPYIPRINNYYLRQFLIKLERKPSSVEQKEAIYSFTRKFFSQQKFQSVRCVLDVDPY